jgi:hypothetical protein
MGAGATGQAGHRRGADDAAAAALSHHAVRGVLDAEKHATHEHGKGEVPLLDQGLPDRPEGAADPGVVEHAVEPAETRHGQFDQARHIPLL